MPRATTARPISGADIRRIREGAGQTQAEAARDIGVSVATISHMERSPESFAQAETCERIEAWSRRIQKRPPKQKPATPTGDMIREHRLRIGSTQETVAAELGTSASVVSSWERGAARPSLAMAERIRRWLRKTEG